MKKNVFVLLLVAVFMFSCGIIQVVDSENRCYNSSFKVSHKDQEVIYQETLEWISDNLVNSYGTEIAYTDKENGKISVHGKVSCYPMVNLGAEAPTRFNLKVTIKDHDVDLRFDNYVMFLDGYNKHVPKQKVYIDEINEHMMNFSYQLSTYLNKDNPDNY